MAGGGKRPRAGRPGLTYQLHALIAQPHCEYENYAWKITKDGDNAGIEDPKCANHLTSAARYALTMFAGQGGMFDPAKPE